MGLNNFKINIAPNLRYFRNVSRRGVTFAGMPYAKVFSFRHSKSILCTAVPTLVGVAGRVAIERRKAVAHFIVKVDPGQAQRDIFIEVIHG